MNKLIIHTDGGARGNPGPAAIGVYIQTETGKPVTSLKKYIGIATNNTAEYQAVIEALQWIREHMQKERHSIDTLAFFLDSELVARQLLGAYKVKRESLKSLYATIQALLGAIMIPATFSTIPREQNIQADHLVNQALDEMAP